MSRSHPAFIALLIIPFLLPFLPVAGNAESATIQWEVKPQPMPIAGRHGMAVVAVDGKIYTFGGHDGGFNNCSNQHQNHVYIPSTETWQVKAPFPACHGGNSFGAAEVGGKIYIFGGVNPLGSDRYSHVDAYDIATDSWETNIADFGKRVAGTTAVAVDGRLFVVIGDICPGPTGGCPTSSEFVEFDTQTNTIIPREPLPSSHLGARAAVVDGRIYVFGNDGGVPVTVEIYDPVTDTWDSGALSPFGMGNYGAAEVFGKVFLYGGATVAEGGTSTVVMEYDPLITLVQNTVYLPR